MSSHHEPSLDDSALSTHNDRVRAILGVCNGPLPPVERKWLRRYHDYLTSALSLPFCAFYHEAVSPLEDISHAVVVVGLTDLGERALGDGLMCRAMENGKAIEVPLMELEVEPQSPNFCLIEDYWCWAWNERSSSGA